jgi:hypothetical protein
MNVNKKIFAFRSVNFILQQQQFGIAIDRVKGIQLQKIYSVIQAFVSGIENCFN